MGTYHDPLDAYEEYVARKRERENPQPTIPAWAVPVPPGGIKTKPWPQEQKAKRKGLSRGWKLYWGFWAAVIVVLAVVAAHMDSADNGKSQDWPWSAYFAILALWPIVAAIVIAFLAAIVIDDNKRINSGGSVNPWGPTQNQLLRRQTQLLEQNLRAMPPLTYPSGVKPRVVDRATNQRLALEYSRAAGVPMSSDWCVDCGWLRRRRSDGQWTWERPLIR
jgi:hypothetical protein